MTKPIAPIAIPLAGVDASFREGKSTSLAIVGLSGRQWIFRFEVADPRTGETRAYTLKTQRGKMRIWSNPKTLLYWLRQRYGVTGGSFYLQGNAE